MTHYPMLDDKLATLRNAIEGGVKADTMQAMKLMELVDEIGEQFKRELADAPAVDAAVDPVVSNELHQDTAKLVRRFARALGNKLLAAQRKYGYSNGWMRDGWMNICRAELMQHIEKGDPRDVAAYCAFLWHHNEPTFVETATPAASGQKLTDEQIEEIAEAREILENMVRSIELDGNYSTEATCTFIRQAILCLPVASDSATASDKEGA